jgi:crotonobetainyl-CoA:carnitine CoA-transferase CaiB-like acyl-CoA transferase
MVLADLGAEVIKFELPNVGDEGRDGAPFYKGESTYFHSFNRNKKGVTLNLRKPEAQDLFKRMIKDADAVVENFTPGTMDEMNIGYETLSKIHPGIIMASISGFGQKNSPYVKRVCYDAIAQAVGGLMSLNGYPDTPPTRVGTSLGDMVAGTFTALGICAALYERNKSGKGQHVDVALVDTIFSLLEHAPLRYTATGEIATRLGNRHPALSPFNNYKAKDGWVAICTASNPVSFRLAQAIGRPDLITDPRYASNTLRVKNADHLEPIFESWVADRTCAEVYEQLQKYDVPCGKINTIADIVADPHFTERGMLVDINHPVAGPMKVVGPTIKFSRTPCTIHSLGPDMGGHNEEIFKDRYNMTDQEYNELKEKKII